MHVMLDLETLGTRHTSIILSIGAVWFDPVTCDLFEEFDRVLEIDQQRVLGRTQDESTLRWWHDQSPEAQKRVFSDENAEDVTKVLDAFDAFLKLHPLDGLWGNGAAFDNALIRSLYISFGRIGPVSYKLDRCYRTLWALMPADHVASVRVGVQHNALDDAKHQAICAVEMLQHMPRPL